MRSETLLLALSIALTAQLARPVQAQQSQIEILQAAIAKNYKDPNLHYLLAGELLKQLDRVNEKKQFQICLELNPSPVIRKQAEFAVSELANPNFRGNIIRYPAGVPVTFGGAMQQPPIVDQASLEHAMDDALLHPRGFENPNTQKWFEDHRAAWQAPYPNAADPTVQVDLFCDYTSANPGMTLRLRTPGFLPVPNLTARVGGVVVPLAMVTTHTAFITIPRQQEQRQGVPIELFTNGQKFSNSCRVDVQNLVTRNPDF